MLTENKLARDDRYTLVRSGEMLPLRGWTHPPEGELAIDYEPDVLTGLPDGDVWIHTFVGKEHGGRYYCARSGYGRSFRAPTFEMALRHCREQDAMWKDVCAGNAKRWDEKGEEDDDALATMYRRHMAEIRRVAEAYGRFTPK